MGVPHTKFASPVGAPSAKCSPLGVQVLYGGGQQDIAFQIPIGARARDAFAAAGDT